MYLWVLPSWYDSLPPFGSLVIARLHLPPPTYVNINTSPMPESYHQFKILVVVNTSIVQSRCCIFLQKKPWVYYSMTINNLIDMTSKDTAAPSQDILRYTPCLVSSFLSSCLNLPTKDLRPRTPYWCWKPINCVWQLTAWMLWHQKTTPISRYFRSHPLSGVSLLLSPPV